MLRPGLRRQRVELKVVHEKRDLEPQTRQNLFWLVTLLVFAPRPERSLLLFAFLLLSVQHFSSLGSRNTLLPFQFLSTERVGALDLKP